jgi:putative membrane protein
MMTLISALVALVAFLHFYFMILEMVFWQKPLGMKTFQMNATQAKATARLALNQGLYNGFLAAGLVASLCFADLNVVYHFQVFFLSCVVAAGISGGLTIGRKVFFVQALPALIALLLLLFY